MNATATLNSILIRDVQPVIDSTKNPWVSDHVLLSLSVWWVRMTEPNAGDFNTQVASVFDDLQRDLQ